MTIKEENQDKIQSLEAKVEQLTQELQAKDKQLEETRKLLKQREKLAFLGEMSAMAFHDLLNHLNTISMNESLGLDTCQSLERSFQGLTLFLEEVVDDFFEDREIINKIKSYFIKIEEQVLIIDKMLINVAAYRQSQEEKLQYQEINLVETNLNNFVSDCLDLACQSGQLKKKNQGEDEIKLNLETDYDLSINSVALPLEEIRRILINIIDNSYYSIYEKQKQKGENYLPTIYLKTQWLNNGIRIVIKDNGQGIPEHRRKKSTHPFFTTKPSGEGTGLGLYIVTKLVDKIQGTMRIKSEENEYTKVSLFIPIN